MLTDSHPAESSPQRLLRAAAGALEEDPAAALRLVEQFLTANPDHPRALHIRGEALARSGQVRAGEALMREAIAVDGALAELGAEPSAQPASRSAWIGRFEPEPCLICGASEGTPVWGGNLSRTIPAYNALDPVRVWLKCGGCGVTRVERPVPTRSLEAWRKAARAETDAPPTPAAFSEALVAQDEVVNRIREEGYGNAWMRRGDGLPQPMMLQVGSGWGSLLAAARWRGFEVVGLEADRRRAEWSAGKLGVEVHHGQLERGIPEGPFDAIVMSAPLDAFERPVAVLRSLSAQLEEGGLLALMVPTLDHPVHQLRGAQDPLWSRPERRVWYDRMSLAGLLVEANLQAVGSWHDPLNPGSAIIMARPLPAV